MKLVIAPSLYTLNSTFTEREDLVEKRGPMELLVHPEDALAREISQGDRIVAFNQLAKVHFFARITPEAAKGTVVSQGVFTLGQSLNGLTANALCSHRLTDAGEGSTYCDNTIEIRRAD